ncbi:PVC-type heme-binding CxxCH protein [Anatilimnocola floriformis]|uniref:PVC-type heme-binding CxxCH protein n=1 Tax=Anatilimnocola floriformis TaxID=2948575 RepID=UPI0020C4FD60|nr:PVC-type heme-binding CxxCH protein [Anatilimnocola floriformis]
MARSLLGIALLLVSLLPSVASAQKCLAPDFQVDLIYSPPDIEHPSVVTCDDAGNLYVGEDPMDMRGPTTKHIDRIIFIRWDKETGKPIRTVFAENLAAVFGMAWHDGALYVMHAPLYSVFRDTNGDGVADERKDLASGFGPPAGVFGFNDHIVTGTRLGMDGYVYISVGDKGIPKATGADGSTITLEGGGVARMRLDGTRLEVVTSGTRNHLDVAMDSLDNIFTYDNTDDGLGWWTRFTHHVPSGYYGYPYDYLKHAERHLPRISEHGGGSPVGAACYREAAWPAKFQDAAFHCEWGKGKVQVFFPKRKGATFEATMEDFLVKDPASKEDFRPQDLCFSPDGKHMYVGDWNFGGWTNPKVCGRLWRVTYTGKEGGNPAALDADPFKSLSNPNHAIRMQAQWKASKQPGAADKTLAILNDVGADKFAKIHALWIANDIAEANASYDPLPAFQKGLVDKNADVRAQAARAIGNRKLNAGAESLVKELSDEDAAVRLNSAIALGRIAAPAAAKPLFAELADEDATVRHIAMQSLRQINDWKPAKEILDSDNTTQRNALLVTLTGVYSDDAVAALAWAAENAKHPEVRAAAVEAIAEAHHKADPYEKGWWGTQPAKGKPARSKIHDWSGTSQVLATVRTALTSKDEGVRRAAFKVVGEVRDPAALPIVAGFAADTKLPADLRREALQTLLTNKAPQTVDTAKAIVGDDNSPAPLLADALTALATLKAKEALPSVQKLLVSKDVEVRAKAIDAVARMAGSAAVESIQQALKDESADVRKVAIRAAGEAQIKEAIPALIEISTQADLEQDVAASLALMPDKRAVGQYLQGLSSKNNTLRDACRTALTALKIDIKDEIIARHKANELTPAMRRELQGVFAGPTPISTWYLLGSFPKDKGEPKVDLTKAPDMSHPVVLGEKSLQWKKVETKDPVGRVQPGQHVKPSDNVWVLAYTTIEADEDKSLEFLIGSDDQAKLYVNGEKVYEFNNNRGWNGNSLDKGRLTLKKGKNDVFFLCGNDGGPWDMGLSLRLPNKEFAFLYENTPKQLDPEVYRDFAAKNKGDAAHGKTLFFDMKGVGCVKCHAIAGQGSKVGPELSNIGAKYPREELIRSVLEPSNRVAEAFRVTTALLADGSVKQGIIKTDNDQVLELIDVEGKTISIPKADIDEHKTSNLSLMPNGLKDGLSLQDFADVIGYLESLK